MMFPQTSEQVVLSLLCLISNVETMSDAQAELLVLTFNKSGHPTTPGPSPLMDPVSLEARMWAAYSQTAGSEMCLAGVADVANAALGNPNLTTDYIEMAETLTNTVRALVVAGRSKDGPLESLLAPARAAGLLD